ncbi:MAG: hypothetical protein GWN16_11050, partial [Calditrichae bacterium]|nr:hypothetical protein [Calditrichia bacterium]
GDKQIISELYVRGRLLVKFEEWTKAGEIFAEILHRLEAHPYPSIGFQVECKYWIAQALYENDQPVEAYKLADDALQQSEERDKDTELEGQFESFDKIKDHLEDFYDDLKEEIELSGDLSG